MSRTITVDARWIPADGVWVGTSDDVPGLVVEAATWTDMIGEVRVVLPDLLHLSGHPATNTIVFRAEERLDLVA